MILGLIDSAGMTSVIDCLHVENLDRSSPWAYRTAIESTVALMRNPSFGLMPSPEPNKESVGDFAEIQSRLGLATDQRFPSEAAHAEATRKSNRWVRDHRDDLRTTFSAAYHDQDRRLWLDHEIDFIWAFHAKSQGALFNRSLIPQIAHLVESDESYLNELHRLSGNTKELARMIKTRPDTADFDTLCKAYVGAFYLRGPYHDYLADANGHVVLPHRLRRIGGFLPRRKQTPIQFVESQTAARLADLILRSARTNTTKHRAQRYADYVVQTRHNREQIDLAPKSTVELGEEATINAARVIGIRTRGQWFDDALDAGLTLLVGGITSFLLSPRLGFAATIGVWATSRNKNVGRTLGQMFETERRIRGLMDQCPQGRLHAVWQP